MNLAEWRAPIYESAEVYRPSAKSSVPPDAAGSISAA